MLNKSISIFITLVVTALLIGCYRMSGDLSTTRRSNVLRLDWSYAYALKQYESLLSRVVDGEGLVNYKSLMSEPNLSDLNNIQLFLQEFYATRLKGETKLSFWLNAYNIYVLYHVVRHLQLPKYRTEAFSVVTSKNFFKKPWCHFKDLSISLDEIEKTILIKYFKRPEIHFGLVCASLGCPKSLTVFHAATVTDQLHFAGYKFTNTETIIDHANQKILVSKIFDWYSQDFAPKNGSTFEKMSPWLSSDLKSKLKSSNYELRFNDYDWNLNDSNKIYQQAGTY